MEYSYENYSGPGDDFFYDPTPFYTDEVFNSRDELTNWAKTTGRSLGYVLVTKRSNKNAGGDVCRVLLKCDRGGVYKGKGTTSIRSTGTKKNNCLFELEGYFTEYNGWRVNVKNHEHNHAPAEYLEGHAYARRLSQAETDYVETLWKQNLQPRDIIANLKQQFPENVSIEKDVYNVIASFKAKEAVSVGSTPMQVLLSLLHVNNYVFQFTTDDISNRLENLFFVHQKSFEVWRAFPHVLIIDATYKTNIYNMPFVEIVGVTSSSKTFCIAFVFMQNEKEVTYKWALECLKLTLGECMHPRVIVTDRDLSLMNACRDVFPDAARLLCRFHISQNILKNCKGKFALERDWGSFLHRWTVLVQSRTEKEYANNEFNLQLYLKDFPGVFRYLDQNWLSDYKRMFVSCWVDEHLNFRNYTTNRVEGEHALLKMHLGSNKSSLHNFLGAIDHIVNLQLTAIKESFERSKINRKHQHNLPCLSLLRGVVSEKALDIIMEELQRLNDIGGDLSCCGCKVLKSCGLPCACQLSVYLNNGQRIPLGSINIFWRKLDLSPSTYMQHDDILEMEDDDMSVDEELQRFKESFHKQSKSVKKSWIRKLKDIFNPSRTEIKEPIIQMHTRGRPSTKKKRDKILPDLNIASEDDIYESSPKMTKEPSILEKSRSMHSYGFDRSSATSGFPESHKAPARHSSYLSSQPRLEVSLEDEIPSIFHPYIARIVNVGADGNCGFRALAVAMGLDEEGSYDWVRSEMLAEYDFKKGFYDRIFNPIDRVYESLIFSGSPRPKRHWMQIPEAGVLIANRFGFIVHCISMSGSTTVFPFWIAPETAGPHRALSIALVWRGSHFVMVELRNNYPMPMITPYWRDNRDPCATGWEDVYRERLDHYLRLCYRQPVYVDITG